jgi:hypothetical protein
MKSFTVLIPGPNRNATMREFAEFFEPLFQTGRADIVDVDATTVITFIDDEDVVVMHLTFGNKIEVVDPPHDWDARAMRWWTK